MRFLLILISLSFQVSAQDSGDKEFIELYTENRQLKDLSLMMEEITKNPDLSDEIMYEFLKEEE